MTLKDLHTGKVLENVTGKITCMAISFDEDDWFECAWCKLELEGADLEILDPKKKFGQSGVYPWVKVKNPDTFRALLETKATNIREGEFLIPWSSLKPHVK